ncbi:MAG: hypothetical protein WA058_03925 [Minisyncoccia bacterium]
MYPEEDRGTNFVVMAQRKATLCFKVLARIFIGAMLVYLAIVLSIALAPLLGNAQDLLLVLDRYAPLILNSWSMAVLAIGLTLLITQRGSIDEFIRRRMTKAGPGGVEGGILNPQESQAELDAASSDELPAAVTAVTTPGVAADKNTFVYEDAVVSTESAPAKENLATPEPMSQIQELSRELTLERTYNLIFGTQISVLVWLRNNLTGLWYTALANVYEQWRTNDEILKNYSLDNYIGFLIANSLIIPVEEMGGRKFRITDLGLDFLGFIERRGYSQYKPH